MAMDEGLAHEIAERLFNLELDGWSIGEYVGHGKSAVVVKGSRDDETCALKFFDTGLIERFGKERQVARIKRELSIIGQRCDHLVKVYGGGYWNAQDLHYVLMELIDAPNLADVIKVDFPRKQIRSVISQIALATQFLESLQLAHRDIKPQNVAYDKEEGQAKLLDLGVLRPFGDGDLTDEDERSFIGTLRYSSPEFLLRHEADTPEGWRAVTFYQLGATLHDMIMRKPLFQESSNPYARLVEAVRSEKPMIKADDVPEDLLMLARNCLVKDPELRLRLVKWEDFVSPAESKDNIDAAKERMGKRKALSAARTAASVSSVEKELRAVQRLVGVLAEVLSEAVHYETAGSDLFPPVTVSNSIDTENRAVSVNGTFEASTDHALAQPVHIVFRCKLLHIEAEAVEVSVAACLSADPPNLDGVSFEVLFTGVVNKETIAEIVRQKLYLVLDAAQGICEDGGNAARIWIIGRQQEVAES